MPLRLATYCMGTRFELVLHGEDERFLRAAGEAALDEIEGCDQRFSLFRRDSLLARINREAATRQVRVDAEAFALFELCDDVAGKSGFAFDPTVAPLMRELGFHDRARADEAIDDEIGGVVGWHHVELDSGSHAIRFRDPGVTLDLGGVAKGFGLDQAARVLREEGVTRAFLQGGTSTMLALGAPPPARDGWRVALADHPGAPVAHLRDGALSVSAPHGRTVRRDGETLTHVMDPDRRRPVDNGIERAAVLGASAAATDAWSTALLVRGRDLDVPDELHTLLAIHSTGSGERHLEWHGDASPPSHSPQRHPMGLRFHKPTENQQSA